MGFDTIEINLVYLLDDNEQTKINIEACFYCGKYFKVEEGKKL